MNLNNVTNLKPHLSILMYLIVNNIPCFKKNKILNDF